MNRLIMEVQSEKGQVKLEGRVYYLKPAWLKAHGPSLPQLSHLHLNSGEIPCFDPSGVRPLGFLGQPGDPLVFVLIGLECQFLPAQAEAQTEAVEAGVPG